MLLVPTEVRSSSIEGVGLFAKKNIRKGTVVWRFDSRIDRVYSVDEIKNMPQVLRHYIVKYSFFWEEAQIYVFSGDNDHFINHAKNANLKTANGFTEVVAIKDIRAGEEMTTDYIQFSNEYLDGSSQHKKVDWIRQNKHPKRQLKRNDR